MTTDELLKPRYKVIADYPQSGFKVGDIWPNVAPDWTTKEQRDFTLTEMAQYPHLFKPLQWWEERKASEMPEYVWYNATGFEKKQILKVLKVKQWHIDETEDDETDVWAEVEGDTIGFSAAYMTNPATLDEYNSFINQNPKTNG